jgi:hypothetical protein
MAKQPKPRPGATPHPGEGGGKPGRPAMPGGKQIRVPVKK